MRFSEHFSSETKFLEVSKEFRLESGESLPSVRLAYRTWGCLGPAGDNAVLVCHALTGSADVDDWWGGLLGPGRALDPERDFIVCCNVIGSCYGSSGPSDKKGKEEVWGSSFPEVTIRDMVHLQASLLEHLGVRSLELVIGGSMGGMQVLEWGALYPHRVRALLPIAVSARHSPWCIALGEAQRAAIRLDPCFLEGGYRPEKPPLAGLALARHIAMISYRSWEGFQRRFGRRRGRDAQFQVEQYLQYQGEKLVGRFDANAYITLTRAMDSHDLGRGRGSYDEVLGRLQIPALVVAIDSDVLYPIQEQQELARLLPLGELAVIRSPHGHDGFLLETDAMNHQVLRFRQGSTAAAVA